jgi:hypothetical protein
MCVVDVTSAVLELRNFAARVASCPVISKAARPTKKCVFGVNVYSIFHYNICSRVSLGPAIPEIVYRYKCVDTCRSHCVKLEVEL